MTYDNENIPKSACIGGCDDTVDIPVCVCLVKGFVLFYEVADSHHEQVSALG